MLTVKLFDKKKAESILDKTLTSYDCEKERNQVARGRKQSSPIETEGESTADSKTKDEIKETRLNNVSKKKIVTFQDTQV